MSEQIEKLKVALGTPDLGHALEVVQIQAAEMVGEEFEPANAPTMLGVYIHQTWQGDIPEDLRSWESVLLHVTETRTRV